MQPKPHKHRPVTPWIRDLILEDTKRRIQQGYAKWGESRYASAVVAAKQPNKGPDARRIAADYTEVNRVAECPKYPVKNQGEVVRRLHGSKRFISWDLYKGFNQIKLTSETSELLATITPHGLVLPLTCPFGVYSLPGYFPECYVNKSLPWAGRARRRNIYG